MCEIKLAERWWMKGGWKEVRKKGRKEGREIERVELKRSYLLSGKE